MNTYGGRESTLPVVGVLDKPHSAKPAQRSSHTGPPAYVTWRAGTAAPLTGLADYKIRLKLSAVVTLVHQISIIELCVCSRVGVERNSTGYR